VFPKLVEIPVFGGIPIFAYGTLIVVAFLVAAWWTRRAARTDLGIDPERTFNVGFALLFLGLAGARLVYAFANYGEFVARPMSFLRIWEGGLVGYGGLVAGLLWLAWWLPRKPELRGFAFLDVLARGACIAFAVGWFASLLAGDDYGAPTKAAWGLPYSLFKPGTPAAAAGIDDPAGRIHPTQVYESLLAAALFVVLAVYARRRPPSGRVAAWFLMLHSVGHAVIELFRGDPKRGMVIEGVLSASQLLAIPVFFTGLAILLIRRAETRAPVPEPAG
jgi:phosphatidylglycerol:prolipoprotein diacylglycerol transferase